VPRSAVVATELGAGLSCVDALLHRLDSGKVLAARVSEVVPGAWLEATGAQGGLLCSSAGIRKSCSMQASTSPFKSLNIAVMTSRGKF